MLIISHLINQKYIYKTVVLLVLIILNLKFNYYSRSYLKKPIIIQRFFKTNCNIVPDESHHFVDQ